MPQTTTVTKDDSLKSGILMHGEHWVDLILRQAGTDDPRPLKVFTETLQQLMEGVRSGHLGRINEKVDGSPSVVFGFTAKGKPFVAYKGHFTKKEQTLVTTKEEAENHFKRSPALKAIFSTLFAAAEGPLKKTKAKLKKYIFQGDLLFVKGDDDRRKVSDQEVRIEANSLAYVIHKDHPFYEALKNADAAVVFHTVGERVVEGDGRLNVKAMTETSKEEALVHEFAQGVNSQTLFAMDPWRDNVEVKADAKVSASQVSKEVEVKLALIQKNLANLSSEFRDSWRKDFEPKWRTFFNSGLRPPFDGGFYKEASSGEPVNVEHWIEQFGHWLKSRSEDALAEKYDAFVSDHKKELAGLIEAYAASVAIQYKIQPFLKQASTSKLGGGEVEGLILKTEDSIVKWVDRLDFTLRNNARWNRGGQQAPVQSLETLPQPLNEWHPDASFVVMKGQPIHAGHIEMIRKAVALNPGKKIYIIASDKAPNLEATEWKKLKATDTKKDLQEQKYTYIFNNEFREQLLRAGLKDVDAEIAIVNPGFFWSYVRTAKAQSFPGKIKLVVGEKEVTEGRYTLQLQELGEQFELLSIPLTQNGLSATQVRNALKTAVLGNRTEQLQAMATLDQAFGYLSNDIERRQAIQEALSQWKKLDEVAQSLISSKPKKKAANQ